MAGERRLNDLYCSDGPQASCEYFGENMHGLEAYGQTFHRSFGKGSSSAVMIVRCKVDVQTDTGIVFPSAVCTEACSKSALTLLHNMSAVNKLQ